MRVLIAWYHRLRRSSSVFLSVINVVCASIAFLQGILVARWIRPEQLGVIAIIAGMNGAILNFFDVRLVDIAGKLYYRVDLDSDIAVNLYRSSVLQLCLLGNVVIAIMVLILGTLANMFFSSLFTDRVLFWNWIVTGSVVFAISHVSSTLTYIHRFSGKFFAIGWSRLISQLSGIVLVLSVLSLIPNLDGYYLGILLSSCMTLLVTGVTTLLIWKKVSLIPQSMATFLLALPEYWRGLRLLFFGNLLGYSKMLHRSTDILLVGYFCNDRDTGLYRLARTLADGLMQIFDAMNQVYVPHFLDLLSQNRFQEYRRLARRLLLIGASATLVFLVAELLFLGPVIHFLLTDQYAGIEPAVMAFTVPFFFAVGIYLWAWPVFIHTAKIGAYTGFTYVACVAQYVGNIVLFLTVGATVTQASIGYLFYYVVMFPVAIILAIRYVPTVVPIVRLRFQTPG